MPYTKSIVSAVLTVLVMVGAPFDESTEARPLKILCIGLGGGSVPSFLAEMLPNCLVDTVELEPAVIEASKAMGFERGDRIRLWQQDGATFAYNAARGNTDESGLYDAVIVDAYDVDGNVPADFTTADSTFVQAPWRPFDFVSSQLGTFFEIFFGHPRETHVAKMLNTSSAPLGIQRLWLLAFLHGEAF